jgi:anti-repressor protein
VSAVELFTYPETGQPIRTVALHGEPWFVAKDACDVLGISKHRDAVAGLDPDERASTAVDTLGGRQAMSVVSEPGLYALMMISRSPKARQFQRWVHHDVLPSIRKTGGYAVAAPVKRELSKLEVLEMALESERRALAAEARNAELEPKAAQADHFREADGLFAIAQFCNDLALFARENHGVKLLHEQVRDFLGEIGMVIRSKSIRRNEPTAAALKAGWMRPKHTTVERSTGPQEKTSARLTTKGWGHAWDRALQRLAAAGSLDKPKAIERRSA